MTTNVYLADDQAVVRDGLRALLEDYPGITVVGDTGSGNQAVKEVKSLHPDVVLMDISMQGINGLDATQMIRDASPQTHIVILSVMGSPESIFRAFKAGARGYLLKESAGKEVIEAILSVAAGKIYLSQTITSILITDYLSLREAASKHNPLDDLSQRERQVLQLVVDGWTSAEIGKHLHLSTKTVESYRSRIMHKLGVSDITGLMKYAWHIGLVA